MLTCVKLTWKNIVVPFICIFTVNTISAAPLRRNDPDSYLNFNTRLEAGFDLTQEDMLKFHIWPKGTIPYYIDDFSFDKVLRDRMRVFLDGVNQLTSLHFVEIPRPPEDEETRWVLFLNRKGLLGCADHSFKNFTNKGVQRVVLGYHCMNSDENLAELVLSLVGVPPQHNAPDRDARVNIMKENIIPDKLHLFEKLKDNEWLFHDLTYDFDSAGHYGPYKHTSNGKITVRRKSSDHFFDPLTSKPKDKGFSSQDILKISMLYNYILRNRETPVPECSKLFAPGSKLPGKLSKNMNLKIEPRQKPRRYLGESEKEEVDNKQENDFEENNNDEEMSVDNERIDDKEMNSENDINENNNSKNFNEDKENDENDYRNNEIEKKDETLKLNNYLINSDQNDINSKENGDIDHNGSEDEENGKKLSVDNNMSGDNDENLNNNSKKEENDDNDGDQSEDKDIKVDNKSKISDRESNKSNENEEVTEYVTTSDSIVNTTRTRVLSRMPLAYKKPNLLLHKLLNQSDYESGDERKNKYIHEKTF